MYDRNVMMSVESFHSTIRLLWKPFPCGKDLGIDGQGNWQCFCLADKRDNDKESHGISLMSIVGSLCCLPDNGYCHTASLFPSIANDTDILRGFICPKNALSGLVCLYLLSTKHIQDMCLIP